MQMFPTKSKIYRDNYPLIMDGKLTCRGSIKREVWKEWHDWVKACSLWDREDYITLKVEDGKYMQGTCRGCETTLNKWAGDGKGNDGRASER